MRVRSWILPSLLGLTVLVGTLALALSTISATDSDQEIVDGNRDAGEARAEGSEQQLGVVGQQPISEADLLEKVQAVEANLAYMHGAIQSGSPNSAFLQSFIELIGRHGVPNVALASVIQGAALHQMALDQGYSASKEEVASRVQQNRDLLQSNEVPAKIAAYIDAVGVNYYWFELYPRIAEREIVVNKMWTAVTSELNSQPERTEAWRVTQQTALSSIALDWPPTVDTDVGQADVDGALAYLNEYWQFR